MHPVLQGFCPLVACQLRVQRRHAGCKLGDLRGGDARIPEVLVCHGGLHAGLGFDDDRVRQAVGGANQVAVEVTVVHARHEDVLGHGGPGQVGIYRHTGGDRVLLALRQEDRGAAVAGGQNRLQLLDRAREDVTECFGDVLVAFHGERIAHLEGVRDTLLDGHIPYTFGLDFQEGQLRVQVATGTNLEGVVAAVGCRVVALHLRGVEVDRVVGEVALAIDFHDGGVCVERGEYLGGGFCVDNVLAVHAGLHGGLLVHGFEADALPLCGDDVCGCVSHGSSSFWGAARRVLGCAPRRRVVGIGDVCAVGVNRRLRYRLVLFAYRVRWSGTIRVSSVACASAVGATGWRVALICDAAASTAAGVPPSGVSLGW